MMIDLPQGVFLVVILRTLVGILTGPFTFSSLSLAPLIRSWHTFSKDFTFLEVRVILILWTGASSSTPFPSWTRYCCLSYWTTCDLHLALLGLNNQYSILITFHGIGSEYYSSFVNTGCIFFMWRPCYRFYIAMLNRFCRSFACFCLCGALATDFILLCLTTFAGVLLVSAGMCLFVAPLPPTLCFKFKYADVLDYAKLFNVGTLDLFGPRSWGSNSE